MKTAVLLSGCGVYDGTEIHESVLALLALSQDNLDFICTAPDLNQHHVINHINGEEMKEERKRINKLNVKQRKMIFDFGLTKERFEKMKKDYRKEKLSF